jgi:hypothetical protein
MINMMLISVRFSPKFSFNDQVAMCEVRAVDKELGIQKTFEGLTFRDAFDKFKKDTQSDIFAEIG